MSKEIREQIDKIKNWSKFLNENSESNEIITPNENFLYHGSNIKNLDSIKKYGLVPDFGDVVKGTEAYEYYMDDDYYKPENRIDGVLFFSDNPDTWSYSHFGGTPNINEAVLVIIEKNDTIFRKVGDYVYDINNNKVELIKYNRYDYLDIEQIPPFIENGDYFSFDEQEPIDILFGERLIKFITENKYEN
jgi:hypothetical protein